MKTRALIARRPALATLATLLVFAATASGVAAASTDDTALIKRGAYLARAGDCIACHTIDGGKPFSGGRPLQTPVGTVYSTNITPDPDTGIGLYSYQAFDNAVRHGIAQQGYSLYPTMPYPSYAKLQKEDVQALYAYFMHDVTPEKQANHAPDISWPLSMRWPLALWRKAFAPPVDTDNNTKQLQISNVASPDQASLTVRGRYLVEGLGHCGACHSPRGFAFQETALSDVDRSTFLSGAPIDGWFASNLRSDLTTGLRNWSEHDIAVFLRTGKNAHSSAFGPMSEVVQQSTQYLTDNDLTAIAVYLKTIGRAAPPFPVAGGDKTATALRAGIISSPGARVFLNNCAACHRTDGNGYSDVFPRLSNSSAVKSENPTSIIHIVLTGGTSPSTRTSPSAYTMPGFADRLSNSQVADVVTFIRQSWSNNSAQVSEQKVYQVEEELHLHHANLDR